MVSGRVVELTDALEEEILLSIRTGAPLEVSAQACGISPSTFWSWMAAGEGRPSKVLPSERLRLFSEKVRAAEAKTHLLVVGTLRTAAITQGNWQAALGYAKMRWSKFYAERIEVSEGSDPFPGMSDHEQVLLRKAIDEYLVNHPEEIPEEV